MSEFGVTSEGFKTKRLDQLLTELNNEVKAIFGENFNVSPESPDGQINGVVSESNANLWEIAQDSYNAFNPSAATGNSLSNLVQLNGISRLAATSTRTQLTLTGTIGTLILAGSLVSTSDTNTQFSTEVNVTLDGSGNGTVFASTITTGPISALSGTITTIDTPITGWSTVTNLADADEGTDEETDVELRARRDKSVAKDAQAIIDAIFSGVGDILGVTQTVVLENDTNLVDTNGLPPHSFEVIVVGGLDTDIGDVIWLKKPAGILSFGTSTVVVLDSQGLPHDISFSRPTEVDIFVEVVVSKFPDYPVDGDDRIAQAIVDYANGELVAGRGFSLSDDVIYTRLYTPINSIQGHEIDTLFIDTTASPAAVVNIPIGVNEISTFTLANILVTSV
tara:strand:+ start:25771 stop:26949 length:1179 start_codon:yes stop_codon:yes gene_type:complete